ncbi:MAG: DUF4358 domain-containing protein [Ruminococcaceae bacterium]|nr:DUF4358 domain-containing protein [Oscillospiraceae bacterium]
MKRSILIILTVLCFLLPACGSESIDIPEKKSYYDTFKVKGIAVNAEVNLSDAPKFTEISGLILGDSCGIKLDLCDEYIAKKAALDEQRLDEYGIFHCKDSAHLDALYDSVKQYVTNRKNNHQDLSNYSDADTVKNGKISVFGNYVVYTFLPGVQNENFHDDIEEMLLK